MIPISNHLPLLRRQPDKLKPAVEGATDNDQSAHPDGTPNLGSRNSNRDLQAHTKSPATTRPLRIGDIGCSGRQIFGDTGPQRDKSRGTLMGYREKAPRAPFHAIDGAALIRRSRRIETL